MFATNTITGVTMSHPSQLATFTTPHSMYAHKIVSAAQQPPQHLSSHTPQSHPHSNTLPPPPTSSQHSAAVAAMAVNNGLGSLCSVGGGGGAGLLQTSGGVSMMSMHMQPPPSSHHGTQQQSIICASQKRPQSPLAQSASVKAAAAAAAAASPAATSSSSSSVGTSGIGVGSGLLHLQGNGSIVGVNSMGSSGVYTNEAVNMKTLQKQFEASFPLKHKHNAFLLKMLKECHLYI